MSDTETRDYASGWACTDCLMLLANGETPDRMSEAETAEWLVEIERRHSGPITLGRALGDEGCTCTEWDSDEHREGCERTEFSMFGCDMCGSSLGGARDAVTFWLD